MIAVLTKEVDGLKGEDVTKFDVLERRIFMVGTKSKVGAKLKFPEPKDYKPAQPAILCPAERVIGLYNQNSGKNCQKISKTVRKWFFSETAKKGWAGVHFIPEVQSNNGAGCILWRPPSKIDVQVTVTKETLVLMPGNPSDNN